MEFVFVTEIFDVFEWIQNIVVVPGVLRNTMKPQPKHWTNPLSQCDDNITRMSILHSFSKLCLESVPKKICRLQNGTWNLNYIMGLMMSKILYFAY